MTTASYFDITATNRRLRRQRNRAAKQANTPKAIKPPKLTRQKPPIAPSIQHHSDRILLSSFKARNNSQVNTVTTTLRLPPKLQYILNNEIIKASEPNIHPLMKLNAVLNAEAGNFEECRTLLKGVDKILWKRGCSKKVASFAQGRKDRSVKGSVTLHFISMEQLPKGKIPTYLRICANHRAQKVDPYRIRWTVGGNLINYMYIGETYTPTVDQTTAKILFNNVISTPEAIFFCLDLGNFYLETPFNHPSEYEYIYIPAWAIPDDIIEEYNLRPLLKNGNLLAEIRTGMYGLP